MGTRLTENQTRIRECDIFSKQWDLVHESMEFYYGN